MYNPNHKSKDIVKGRFVAPVNAQGDYCFPGGVVIMKGFKRAAEELAVKYSHIMKRNEVKS